MQVSFVGWCRIANLPAPWVEAQYRRVRADGAPLRVADLISPVYPEYMQMIVNVSPEAERMLGELAARNGKPVPEVAGELLEEKLKETASLALADDDDDFDPDALERAIERLLNRTPEQIETARTRLFEQSRPPLPLPEGKTLLDVICGKWPGDETDEEVLAALTKLS